MVHLTARQLKILQAIVEEYVKMGVAVGSETIDKKYNLGVSPATVRNEMVRLIQFGYLRQPHTSAGRVPTSKALRLYISEIMKERELSVREEVSIKQALWEQRNDTERLLRCAILALSQYTQLLSVAVTENDRVYYAGAAYILDIPEFYDIDVTKAVLSLLDKHDVLLEFFSRVHFDNPVKVLLGEELHIHYLEPCGFVFTRYEGSRYGGTGVIGVIGPARLNYPFIVPMVRYFGTLITDAGRNW